MLHNLPAREENVGLIGILSIGMNQEQSNVTHGSIGSQTSRGTMTILNPDIRQVFVFMGKGRVARNRTRANKVIEK
jgi:hypothetical protein